MPCGKDPATTTASVAQALAANTRLECCVLRLSRLGGPDVRELGQPPNRLSDVPGVAPLRLDRRTRSEVGIDECQLGAMSPLRLNRGACVMAPWGLYRPRRRTLEALRIESRCPAAPILERRRSASTFDRCGASIGSRRLLRPPRPLGLRHLADHELARRNLRADVVELREAGVLLPLRARLRHRWSLAFASPGRFARLPRERRTRSPWRRPCRRRGR